MQILLGVSWRVKEIAKATKEPEQQFGRRERHVGDQKGIWKLEKWSERRKETSGSGEVNVGDVKEIVGSGMGNGSIGKQQADSLSSNFEL